MILIDGKKVKIESCLRCAYFQWVNQEKMLPNWCTYWNRKADYPYCTCIAYLEVKLE